jgi:hypothetical protein
MLCGVVKFNRCDNIHTMFCQEVTFSITFHRTGFFFQMLAPTRADVPCLHLQFQKKDFPFVEQTQITNTWASDLATDPNFILHHYAD